MALALSLAEMREVILYAPRDPGKIADGLMGWTSADGTTYCSWCVARILARGVTGAMHGAKAHFKGDGFAPLTCALCFQSVFDTNSRRDHESRRTSDPGE